MFDIFLWYTLQLSSFSCLVDFDCIIFIDSISIEQVVLVLCFTFSILYKNHLHRKFLVSTEFFSMQTNSTEFSDTTSRKHHQNIKKTVVPLFSYSWTLRNRIETILFNVCATFLLPDSLVFTMIIFFFRKRYE